ncbi:hypothetical protein BRD56_07145 [Thermoplasmatales archaeon SW_10_69_26]|nr:MAG: hypothetical protein BRD56_07145 [Thermoplasmatales archaeon SW_10_69_26]
MDRMTGKEGAGTLQRLAAIVFAIALTVSMIPGLTPGVDEDEELVPSASATHARYVDFSWQQTSDENTIEFSISNAWRRDASLDCADISSGSPDYSVSCSGDDGHPVTGDIFAEQQGNTRFTPESGTTIGDGDGGPLLYEVTAYNVTENWVIGVALDPDEFPTEDTTIEHTYASGGEYEAYIDSCCRISANAHPWDHINNPDGDYRYETDVQVGGDNDSPTTNMVPIAACPIDDECEIAIPASDPDGDELRFRLATDEEATGGSGFVHPGHGQSSVDDLEINETTGQITWNTTGAEAEDCSADCMTLYSTQIVVEDLDENGNVKSKAPVDFLIHLTEDTVDPGTAPTFAHPPTPTCGETVPATPQEEVSFDVRAKGEPDRNVTLQASGIPTDASLDPENPSDNPVETTFSWTPSEQDLSSPVVMTFSATDDEGLQERCSITVAREGVDLEVVDLQITGLRGSPDTFEVGEDVQVQATIRNNGGGAIQDAPIRMGAPSDTQELTTTFDPSEAKKVSFWTTLEVSGPFEVTVTTDPDDDIHEFDETNNQRSASGIVHAGVTLQGIHSRTMEDLGTTHALDLYAPGEEVKLHLHVQEPDPPSLDPADVDLALAGQPLPIDGFDQQGASFTVDTAIPDTVPPSDEHAEPKPLVGEAYDHRLNLRIPSEDLAGAASVTVLHDGIKIGLDDTFYELDGGWFTSSVEAHPDLGTIWVQEGEQADLRSSEKHVMGGSRMIDVPYHIDFEDVRRTTLVTQHGQPGVAHGEIKITQDEASLRAFVGGYEDGGLDWTVPVSGSDDVDASESPLDSLANQPLVPYLPNGNEMTGGGVYIATGAVEAKEFPEHRIQWTTISLDVPPGFETATTCREIAVTGDHPHRFSFPVRPGETLPTPTSHDIQVHAYEGRTCDDLPDPDESEWSRAMSVDLVDGSPTVSQVQTVLGDRVDDVADNGTRSLLGNYHRDNLVFWKSVLGIGITAAAAGGSDLLVDYLSEALSGAVESGALSQGTIEFLGETIPALFAIGTHEALGHLADDEVDHLLAETTYEDLEDGKIEASSLGDDLGTPDAIQLGLFLRHHEDKIEPWRQQVDTGDLWSGSDPKIDIDDLESLGSHLHRTDEASWMLSLGDVRTGSGHVPGITLTTPPRPGLPADECKAAFDCYYFGQEHLYETGTDPNELVALTDSYRIANHVGMASKLVGAGLAPLTGGASASIGALTAAGVQVPFLVFSALGDGSAYQQGTIDLIREASPLGRETTEIETGVISTNSSVEHTYNASGFLERVNVSVVSSGDHLDLAVQNASTTWTASAANTTTKTGNETWVEVPIEATSNLTITVSGATVDDLDYHVRVSQFLDDAAREVVVQPETPNGTPVNADEVQVSGPNGTLDVDEQGSGYRVLTWNDTTLDVSVDDPAYLSAQTTHHVNTTAETISLPVPLTPTIVPGNVSVAVTQGNDTSPSLAIANNAADPIDLNLSLEGRVAGIASVPSTTTIPAEDTSEVPVSVTTNGSTLVGRHDGALRVTEAGSSHGEAAVEVFVDGPVLTRNVTSVHERIFQGDSSATAVTVRNQGLANATGLSLATDLPSWRRARTRTRRTSRWPT